MLQRSSLAFFVALIFHLLLGFALDVEAAPGISPRQGGTPLHIYHDGCNSNSRSRTADCMAAMHRYCVFNNKGAAAYSQEVGPTSIAFLCMEVLWKKDVTYDNLPGCSRSATQTQACYSYAHRFCDYMGQNGVGIPLEVGSDVINMACVRTSWLGIVKIAALQLQHSGCRDGSVTQSADCAAAVHRWCSGQNLGLGGLITEVGADEVEVGCISAANMNDVQI